MKTTIITAAAIVLSINSMSAQKVKESEVPKAVVTAFQTHFKGAKADAWDKEKNGEFEAEFKMNKVEMSANFSADGKLMETEEEIATSALPKSATEYVTKNYAGCKIEEAAKITNSAGKITYEAEVKKGKEEIELIFDAKGNFEKKMVEAQDEKKKD
jgi:uncharacterized membrane protein YkoI